jgi:uncharacterized membrane protein
MPRGLPPRLLLALAAAVWAAALFYAPASLYPVGHLICHQRPERSFFFGGHQLPVCARCTGLYIGAALGAAIAALAAASMASVRARQLLVAAALPTAITWSLEFAHVQAFSNIARFAAALPLGVAAAWLVMSTLPDGETPTIAPARR